MSNHHHLHHLRQNLNRPELRAFWAKQRIHKSSRHRTVVLKLWNPNKMANHMPQFLQIFPVCLRPNTPQSNIGCACRDYTHRMRRTICSRSFSRGSGRGDGRFAKRRGRFIIVNLHSVWIFLHGCRMTSKIQTEQIGRRSTSDDPTSLDA